MKNVRHVISVSGGKDSTATLLLALDRCPPGSVKPMFCDTGNEDQAVYDYLSYLEQALDITIVRLKADFTDRMAVHRTRLLAIAEGAADYHPQAKFPWTRERARQAAKLMHPTGIPMLDLCLLKGMFPSHNRQFCTGELKRTPAVEYQLDFIDNGYQVISWQGIRRAESLRRNSAKKIERLNPKMWAFRPIVDWTAEDVFSYCTSKGIQPNPLYKQGMSRVGCMPCVNVNKQELREIALRFPEHIERISQWETLVNEVSRAGKASFLYSGGCETIHQRIDWAKTSRGGQQYDLLALSAVIPECASAFGLCE